MEKNRKMLTWELSHLKAVAWPMTGVDRLAEPEAPGLPNVPPRPWNTGAGGSLWQRQHRQQEMIVVMKMQGEKRSFISLCIFLLIGPLHAVNLSSRGFRSKT